MGFFLTGSKVVKLRKDCLFNIWNKWISTYKKISLSLYLIPYIKN